MLTPKIMHISISTNLSHIRPSNCYPHPFINIYILVKVNSKHPTIIISPHLWCGWGPPPEKLLARGIHAVSREPGMHEKSKHCCIYEFVIIKGNNDKYKENDNKHTINHVTKKARTMKEESKYRGNYIIKVLCNLRNINSYFKARTSVNTTRENMIFHWDPLHLHIYYLKFSKSDGMVMLIPIIKHFIQTYVLSPALWFSSCFVFDIKPP